MFTKNTDNLFFLNSIEAVNLFIKEKKINKKDIFVIGGESIYKKYLSICDKVIITKINSSFLADKHFPNLDLLSQWEKDKTLKIDEENGITFSIEEYKTKG